MISCSWNGPSLGKLLVLAVVSPGAATARVPSMQSSSEYSPSDKRLNNPKMGVTHLRLYGKDKK